jgi:hypothetical protein
MSKVLFKPCTSFFKLCKLFALLQAIRAASAELGGLDGITTFCVNVKSSVQTLHIIL